MRVVRRGSFATDFLEAALVARPTPTSAGRSSPRVARLEAALDLAIGDGLAALCVRVRGRAPDGLVREVAFATMQA